MSKGDVVAFSVAGLVVWALVSLFYAAFGGGLLEAAFWFYALNAFLAAGALLFAFHLVARVTRTSRRRRLQAALTFAWPGIVGGALALANFDSLFAHLDPVSAGRYGAFLTVAYLTVLGSALEPRPAQKA